MAEKEIIIEPFIEYIFGEEEAGYAARFGRHKLPLDEDYLKKVIDKINTMAVDGYRFVGIYPQPDRDMIIFKKASGRRWYELAYSASVTDKELEKVDGVLNLFNFAPLPFLLIKYPILKRQADFFLETGVYPIHNGEETDKYKEATK